MVDRLYENLLELISKRQEQYCNSTLCNLNYIKELSKFQKPENCNSTLCNLNIRQKDVYEDFCAIVIVHYVI